MLDDPLSQGAYFQSKLTVKEFLETESNAVRFAIRNGMECVGCRMAGFCLLEDAINRYGLDQPEQLEEIKLLILNNMIKPTLN